MISIVIPALNEEAELPKLIRYLKKHLRRVEYEIIIADGGSSDSTPKIARELGAKVINSAKGRAKQMNSGARKANGDILYFVHADTFPPTSFYSEITKAIEKGYGAGCFRLGFDDPHPLLKFYSWFTQFNIDFFRFGDQSLFVKKTIFEEIGGFREELVVMEDQLAVKDLKKRCRFIILNQAVITSGRKYAEVGYIRLQIIFAIILTMFYLNIDQQRIVRFYRVSLRKSMLPHR